MYEKQISSFHKINTEASNGHVLKMSLTALGISVLGPTWWYCFRLRRCNLVGRSVILEVAFEI